MRRLSIYGRLIYHNHIPIIKTHKIFLWKIKTICYFFLILMWKLMFWILIACDWSVCRCHPNWDLFSSIPEFLFSRHYLLELLKFPFSHKKIVQILKCRSGARHAHFFTYSCKNSHKRCVKLMHSMGVRVLFSRCKKYCVVTCKSVCNSSISLWT